eukprot:7827392-Prorocentrum_lima.AAC.1
MAMEQGQELLETTGQWPPTGQPRCHLLWPRDFADPKNRHCSQRPEKEHWRSSTESYGSR